MPETKDCWDKLEIIGKVIGSVLIPIVLGVSVLLWNQERTASQVSASMTQIAVSVLKDVPEDLDGKTDPLRSWAISVLQNPESPPPLSSSAAGELQDRSLGSTRSWFEVDGVEASPLCEMWSERIVSSAEKQFSISWRVLGGIKTQAYINGAEVELEGTAYFTFNGPEYDRFRLVANSYGSTCETNHYVFQGDWVSQEKR
ncbi:MAG: hypothetical protein ABJO67_04155 [Pseudoruegeria sp.]